MKGNITYQKAYDELVNIVTEIENEKIQLDQLAAKIRRASELVAFCQEKLREAETEFQQTVKKLTR
ncbi:MAG: exodeoxyribonuclease VII small subunit [Bacteroidetes bacterium]|nr:exodeoxyribonuclease VII small subunit [Bacteroidota bacterium]